MTLDCTITRVSTGEKVTFPYVWEPDDDLMGLEYLWSDGNYGCNCNRHLFFWRAQGIDPERDDKSCDDFPKYHVVMTDKSGTVVYEDDNE